MQPRFVKVRTSTSTTNEPESAERIPKLFVQAMTI